MFFFSYLFTNYPPCPYIYTLTFCTIHALRYDTPTYVLFSTNYDNDGKDEHDYVPFYHLQLPMLRLLILPSNPHHSFIGEPTRPDLLCPAGTGTSTSEFLCFMFLRSMYDVYLFLFILGWSGSLLL